MIAAQSPVKKETLHDSEWVSWERVRAGDAGIWIQQIKFLDRWLFLVTDDAGRNYKHLSSDEECYRIIEEAFPLTALVGNRKSGAIEVAQAASKITL